MKFVKCPICGSIIRPDSKVCPVCRTKFSKLQLFYMLWLKKTIFTLIVIFLFYNVVIIISENKNIRYCLNNIPKDIHVVDELQARYDKLSSLQKMFVKGESIAIIRERQALGLQEHEVVNEDRSIFFPEGSIEGKYTGMISAYQPNGQGIFKYNISEWLSCTYTGNFKGGRITGSGTKEFSDGYKFIGEYDNGALNGYATVYNEKGNVVQQGDFINDKLQGDGTMFDNDKGTIYSGSFEQGIPTKYDYTNSCTSATFEAISSNPDSFKNKNIKIHGRIIDINARDTYTEYIFAPNNSDENRITIYYIGSDEIKIEKRDYVYIYGCCMNNNTSYTRKSIKNESGIGILGFYFKLEPSYDQK